MPLFSSAPHRRVRVRVLRAAATLTLVAGYADLVRGGLTIAPLLLVTSYLLLVPLVLLAD